MKIQFTIILSFLSVLAFGQTGIGTRSPHASAVMELNVSSLPANGKKGLLLNRVALTGTNDVSTIPNPIAGLLVYNTATTTGANAVEANSVYIWNADLNLWERYFSRDEIAGFIEPPNFFIQATANQTTANLGTTLVPVTWTAGDVVVANADVALLDANNTSFTIQKTGIFDVSGFFNYSPQLSESNSTISTTSNQTDVVFQMQRSTNGGGSWTTVTATTTALGRGVGNTFTSIPFPSTTVRLNENDKIRFVVSRNVDNSDPSSRRRLAHGNTAGIQSGTNQLTKSIRVSYVLKVD